MGETTDLKTRREFCAGACQAVSGAAMAALVAACSGGGSPTAPGGGGSFSSLQVVSGTAGGGTVQVSTASGPLASVGGMALVQSAGGLFLVARTGQETFTALTATCTHEACTVTLGDGSNFVCPCHGSRFNSNGQVLNGPAPASLHRFTTAFAADTLTISA